MVLLAVQSAAMAVDDDEEAYDDDIAAMSFFAAVPWNHLGGTAPTDALRRAATSSADVLLLR